MGAPNRRADEQAFSLVELLIAMAIIGVLASVAIPQFLAARSVVRERATVATLRSIVANQQAFFMNPVPQRPSPPSDGTKRYARLHELNAFVGNALGATVSTTFVDAPEVRYSMVPLWPSNADLQGHFVIQAVQQDVAMGFIYQVDESGRVVRVR
jgi:prepilin-type N-terminal cleavage/methylation domain-containing protein